MLISLWRRLLKSDRSRRKVLLKSQRPSFRPKLESLEDRTLPAPLVYGMLPPQPVAPAASGVLSDRQPIHSQPASVAVNQMDVTVGVNSTKSVIDLGPIFARSCGVRPEAGIQVSLLGNTNPALVKPELSEEELTLSYTPSRCGTATITVGAIEADGSCVRENILVTVLPPHPTLFGVSSLIPAGQHLSIMPNASRAA
jgi:hypothetical protein